MLYTCKMTTIEVTNSKKLKNFPVLSQGEIHLWQVSTTVTSNNAVAYNNVLSEYELSKVHYFESQKAKDSYIVSQGALRILLSEYLKVSPNLVKIGRHKKGKPFSEDDKTLFFNISNSGRQVVLAFSRDSELGVDIEQIRQLPDLDEMILKNFSSREMKFINAKPGERLSRFFRFWTVKESYLKAIGEGMRLEPEDIEFFMNNEYISLISVKGVPEQEDWNFKEFTLLNDYVGTITYGKDNSVIKHLKLQ